MSSADTPKVSDELVQQAASRFRNRIRDTFGDDVIPSVQITEAGIRAVLDWLRARPQAH